MLCCVPPDRLDFGLGMVEWLEHLLRNHREASSTPADANTRDAHTCEKLINEIEPNFVVTLQDLGSCKAPFIITQ